MVDSRETRYMYLMIFKCLKSIAKSLKVLSNKKIKGQSSFNSKFYAIYRHYIKYVQTHPWYTKKLSVIDFYCRILDIAYRCGLTNSKLVMSCKNDYLHIKKEYENACDYLDYLIQDCDYQAYTALEVPSNMVGEKPTFNGHIPSRKMLVRLQYDPTVDNISPIQANIADVEPLLKGLCYRVHCQSLDPAWSRAAFFYGEYINGYPMEADAFGFSISIANGCHTPYSIYNKRNYLKKIRSGNVVLDR